MTPSAATEKGSTFVSPWNEAYWLTRAWMFGSMNLWRRWAIFAAMPWATKIYVVEVVVVAVDGGRIAAHELRDQAGGEVVGHHHLRLARVELATRLLKYGTTSGFVSSNMILVAPPDEDEHPATRLGTAIAAAPSPTAFIIDRRLSTGPSPRTPEAFPAAVRWLRPAADPCLAA